MSVMEIVLVVIAVVVVLGLVLGGWYLWRHQELRRRYGPEYDRLAEQDGRWAAERKLRERDRRHAKLELRELDPDTREQYRAAWTQVQGRFVDDPENAIGAADTLITRLAAERGYPTEDREEQVEQISVDHARTLDHYRAARDIYQRHQRGEANTEQLREALVHYRTLFADLLGDEPVEYAQRTANGSRDSRRDASTRR
jgi:hypothetical protein